MQWLLASVDTAITLGITPRINTQWITNQVTHLCVMCKTAEKTEAKQAQAYA